MKLDGKETRIEKSKLNEYLLLGYKIGRKKITIDTETKERCRNLARISNIDNKHAKDTIWINNDIINKRVKKEFLYLYST